MNRRLRQGCYRRWYLMQQIALIHRIIASDISRSTRCASEPSYRNILITLHRSPLMVSAPLAATAGFLSLPMRRPQHSQGGPFPCCFVLQPVASETSVTEKALASKRTSHRNLLRIKRRNDSRTQSATRGFFSAADLHLFGPLHR